MVASAPLGAEQVDLMNARLLTMPDNGTLIAPASPTGLTISSMAGHMMRQLSEDQEYALAFAPADDLLDLPFLKDVPNSLVDYMIAARIGPDLRMAVVGSPSYFDRHPIPKTPQDLAQHNCINLRLRSAGGIYAWELEQGDREVRVRVDGQMFCNNTATIVRAALRGVGLGFVMESSVAEHVRRGELTRVLEDWCPPFAGYHLYYPSRRQSSAAFILLVNALRYRS